jgi:hypothetical protein
VPYRQFDLTAGELPPLLDDRCGTTLRRRVNDFAGFAASCVERERECQRLPVRNPVCQITILGGERT